MADYEVRIYSTDDGYFADFVGTDMRGSIVSVGESAGGGPALIAVKHEGRHTPSGTGQPWHYSGGHWAVYRIDEWRPGLSTGFGPTVGADKVLEWPLR